MNKIKQKICLLLPALILLGFVLTIDVVSVFAAEADETLEVLLQVDELSEEEAEETEEEEMLTGNAAAESHIAQNSVENVGLAEDHQTLQEYLIELQKFIAIQKEQLDAEIAREKLASQTKSETWEGSVLNKDCGINVGPSGLETYYNLDMSIIVDSMESLGLESDYWVRDDGVKMYGNYIMCAADFRVYPRGTIVETSLGTGIVCDTGDFVYYSNVDIDIATSW